MATTTGRRWPSGPASGGGRARSTTIGFTQLVEPLPKLARDAAYVAVGFGVLSFQRAQVRRRELRKRLEELASQLVLSGAPVVENLPQRGVESDLGSPAGRRSQEG